jgi:outer membrane protein
MKMKKSMKIFPLVFFGLLGQQLFSQADSTWILEKCIDFALKQNITVRKSELVTKRSEVNYNQAKAQRLPFVDGSISQNFNLSKNTGTGQSGYSGSQGNNYSVSSGITIFNGSRLTSEIQQALLNIKSSEYSLSTTMESISLNILNAFLQILYSEELVNNSKKQIESSVEQLRLARERLTLKAISVTDYSQVKSQLASEKLTLANAESQLAIARINLMQLMEIPASNSITIAHPELKEILNEQRIPDAKKVFETALSIKPQIKNAAVNKQIAALDEKIARSGYYPSLSANAGMSTGYSSQLSGNYTNQINNAIHPSAGLSLSIPIYQKKQVKTNVEIAKIGYNDAELSETDTRNQLRKSIEQACQDVTSAQAEYIAGLEKYNATLESSTLSQEKFNQGIINSIDYLVAKTNLIVAESDLLQSKYKLIFSYKILDFYEGTPLTL